MTDQPQQTDDYARGYMRGYDVATSRAVSRKQQGLPIDDSDVVTEADDPADLS